LTELNKQIKCLLICHFLTAIHISIVSLKIILFRSSLSRFRKTISVWSLLCDSIFCVCTYESAEYCLLIWGKVFFRELKIQNLICLDTEIVTNSVINQTLLFKHIYLVFQHLHMMLSVLLSMFSGDICKLVSKWDINITFLDIKFCIDNLSVFVDWYSIDSEWLNIILSSASFLKWIIHYQFHSHIHVLSCWIFIIKLSKESILFIIMLRNNTCDWLILIHITILLAILLH